MNAQQWNVLNNKQLESKNNADTDRDSLGQHLESTKSSYTDGRLPVSLFNVWLVEQMWMASWVILEW